MTPVPSADLGRGDRAPAPAVLAALAALAALMATIGLALAAPRPASAHEGDAVITVEQARAAGLTVRYVVRVTWADDGHPAADATVTVTAVDAAGTQLTPVTLTPVDDDGRYGGALEFPAAGAWTARVTSIDPTGTVEQAQTVEAPPATAAPTTAPPATTAVDDTAGAAEIGAAVADDQATSGGGSDGMPVAVIVIAAIVVVGGAVAAVRTIVRTRADLPATGGGASANGQSADADSGAEEVQS